MNLQDWSKTQPRGALGALAAQINAHVPDVSMWASGRRPIPHHRAVAIEKATGGQVTRKDMFPSTWREIWPELDAIAPAPQPVGGAQQVK